MLRRKKRTMKTIKECLDIVESLPDNSYITDNDTAYFIRECAEIAGFVSCLQLPRTIKQLKAVLNQCYRIFSKETMIEEFEQALKDNPEISVFNA